MAESVNALEKTPCLRLRDVCYAYDEGENAREAVRDVTLDVARGEFVAVLGHNGSGKSTLAKLLNGLLTPTRGDVFVLGMNTRDEARIFEIRRRAGLVFQNPDNQIVATVVREDVAFGLENIGLAPAEMPARIDGALTAVGMLSQAERAPHTLSGGQKQRVAIAGVLAMLPDALILDEATAMLDPVGRREVLQTVRALNRDKGITVVWITHFMEEAALASRVVVMDEGCVRMDGAPAEVFARGDELRALGLDAPVMARLSQALNARGAGLPDGILSVEDMAREVAKRCLSR